MLRRGSKGAENEELGLPEHPHLVLLFINTVMFADGACEARSRLDLGSVAFPTNVTVLMKRST